ncbi:MULTISPECIES: RNA polymerase sigma factor [unclassified Bacteroides]|jgi:RNA polymerase sigma-70 factor (ECF subfamily)|uniref:RNA polymerase sigma factor n=1 Tax=unclassified Bacteroides TaxID=2646097 RepID=UPI00033DB257|nr:MULTISPECIES: sigma-70 family RNA polymerase sigma factor [unclassified Bacteroides]CDB09755.1 sigma-70 family RNA polymerase sigma factor [Bacteroides sp. CAG:633]
MTDTNKEKEFTELLLQNQHIIYKVCLMYAQDKEDIADLYQETVYNLWKSYTTFENRSSFSTWLYRVALNTCISDLRRRKHHEYVPLQLTDIDLPDNDPQAEMLNTLYSLVRCLNKLDRMYIVLWLDEKTYDEIAEIVGTNRNQVAVRLHRIKEKLKTMSNL